jgi:carboxylesterase
VVTPSLIHPLAAGFELHPERDDIVLLLHGWTGTPAHMRLLAAELDGAGYGVVAPLLPGHGTSEVDLTRTGWRDWMRGAAEAATGIESSGARLHLAGLSMGALLTLLLAATGDVASVTVVNTPIKVFARTMRLSPLLRGSARIRVEPDPVRAPGFFVDHAHGYRDTPLGTVAELRDLIGGGRRALPRVTAPALVVQSLADTTVRPESGAIVYEELGSRDKKMVWLERSTHLATLDVERDVLAAEVIGHLDAVRGV